MDKLTQLSSQLQFHGPIRQNSSPTSGVEIKVGTDVYQNLSLQSGVKVSISDKAKEKLDKEKESVPKEKEQPGKSVLKQLEEEKAGEAVEEGETSKTDMLDEMIKKLKQQIQKVKQELDAISGEDSEQAQAQRKVLETQLGLLNKALIGLIEEKLAQMKLAQQGASTPVNG